MLIRRATRTHACTPLPRSRWPPRRRLRARAATGPSPALVDGREAGGHRHLLHLDRRRGRREDGTRCSTRNSPSIKLRVERSGAERILQRLMQEYGSNIHQADVDRKLRHHQLLDWKRAAGSRRSCRTMSASWPADAARPGRLFSPPCAHALSVVGYNTQPGEAGGRAARASPTCSTAAMEARSSRRIPAIAAPS